MEVVKEADCKLNPMRYWHLLKSLSGKHPRQSPNQPISFDGKVYTKRSSVANQFCKYYVNVAPFKASKDSRQTFQDLKANPLDHSFTPFTMAQTAAAIKPSKNLTEFGPNGLTALHLKHLGPSGLWYLTLPSGAWPVSSRFPSLARPLMLDQVIG